MDTIDFVHLLDDDLQITQAEVARRLGVTRHTVNRWYRGHTKISPAYAKLIEITLLDK